MARDNNVAVKSPAANAASMGGIMAILAVMLFFLWGLTQVYAHKFGYQPALGAPVAQFESFAIYPPWRFFQWYVAFVSNPAATGTLKAGMYVFMVGFAVILLGGITVVAAITRGIGAVKNYNPFSSEWADDIDVEFSGLLARDSWATKQEIEAWKKKNKK